jgi:RNA polymerase subunit RPABC4/transcription elongation factor Spt4
MFAQKNKHQDHLEPYEEISEKKTSGLGYIMLIIMSIFLIVAGEKIFSDLSKLPKKPQSPSPCIEYITNTPEHISSYSLSECDNLNEVDKKFKLDSGYSSLKIQITDLAAKNKELSQLNQEIATKKQVLDQNKRDYDLSLQERIANEPGVMDQYLSSTVAQTQNEIQTLQNKKASLENEINSIIIQTASQRKQLSAQYDQATDYYKDQLAIWNFKIFIFQLLFILPFFILAIYFYLSLKKKNSPYAIIATAAATSFSILFAQIVLVFLYDILPKEWLERIFDFFMQIAALRYVVYYISIILVIAIFGGIVYYIQKKVFDPAKVAVRRIKEKKCPNCSFLLNPDHNFCPKCGLQLREACPHCGQAKIVYLDHCPVCGKK